MRVRVSTTLAFGLLALVVVSSATFTHARGEATREIQRLASGLSKAVRVWKFDYRSHGGQTRSAYVLLPSWYGPRNDPRIPLVISPHGRGRSAEDNLKLWGDLPAIGDFAVISPSGHGRRLRAYSWGAPGQISDRARMPTIAHHYLPWLHIKRHSIFAVGGSMGGQETLLLLARYPHLLAGAVAFDSVANFALQYENFSRIRCNQKCLRHWNGPIGAGLKRLARKEVGGTPASNPAGYAARSPLHFAHQIAFSGVPPELWWSVSDLVVPEQARGQSGALFSRIRRLNPSAPVEAFVGRWIHTAEDRANRSLPFALAQLGLLPASYNERSHQLHYVAPAQSALRVRLAARTHHMFGAE